MILVITLCLLTNPTSCETHTEALLREVTPFQCAIRAQERVAQIMPLWEGYRLRAWRCEPRK